MSLNMIKLSHIVEQLGNESFYDWTRDFDAFKNTINATTESAKKRFEKSLSSKVLNKQVMVRASKGYKQPVKDYTIDRVTAVTINDFYDDWVVVLKNEFNKEFFLTSGYKIKVMGASVAQEPGATQTPEQPQTKPQTQPPPAQPQAQSKPPGANVPPPQQPLGK